ncbi:MAG: hypothetical protein MRY78_18555 [Saprospiraceae bacterium]|nr:hypothetical protein [Saprospiraceae bacterium]
MPKKKPKKGNPEVNKELDGFNIKINEFGEITSNFEVDKLNEFLNENVEDKKLRESEEEKESGKDDKAE